MNCQERRGFLFAHDCGEPASTGCFRCKKGICQPHQHMTEEGPLCLSCADQAKALPADDARRNPYTYAGASYAGYCYYDADDYGVFERTGAGASSSGNEGDFHGT